MFFKFFRKSECEKFKYLIGADEFSSASSNDRIFTIEHPLRCESCRAYETQVRASLSALRKSASNYSGSENFTDKVMLARRNELQSQKVYGTQLALVGAVTGAVIFLALLQILTIQPKINQGDPTGTARVDVHTAPFTIFETPTDSPKTFLPNDG
ncbi:MAG TPA: hypothetical protein VNK96_08820 [Fimbriimonadales bacterium]|nr:hypothetical protein [Fimbriimonadales bacterium]